LDRDAWRLVVTGTLRVGTSSWSSADWRGPFYPDDAAPGDFLALYAQHFDTVECDATFYRIPTTKTVEGWRATTPEGFLFAAKLPQEITHEKGLVDCGEVLGQFLGVMKRLGHRLGPIVAQFPYVAKGKDAKEYAAGDDFRARLASFLELWPAEILLAVEVRNATWIAPPLLDLLRNRRVTLVFSAYYTMPGPDRLFRGLDPQTTELLYVRFLGDHKRMDERVARLRATQGRTADWNALVVDKEPEMRRWVEHLKRRVATGPKALAYFNNHYAGFAPASAREFLRMWEEGQ